jgi:hypothetical protein
MVPKNESKSYGKPPKPKKKACTVFNLSDTVKILDLLKGGMSLVKVGWWWEKMNHHIQCSTELYAS